MFLGRAEQEAQATIESGILLYSSLWQSTLLYAGYPFSVSKLIIPSIIRVKYGCSFHRVKWQSCMFLFLLGLRCHRHHRRHIQHHPRQCPVDSTFPEFDHKTSLRGDACPRGRVQNEEIVDQFLGRLPLAFHPHPDGPKIWTSRLHVLPKLAPSRTIHRRQAVAPKRFS